MIKVNKIFLQFVCGQLKKRQLLTCNYTNVQLAPKMKSLSNIVLKTIAYEISDFNKEKISI